MRRVLGALAAVAFLGCGSGDPGKSRLEPGAEVVVISDVRGKDTVEAEVDDGRVFAVPSGAKVRVVRDSEGEEMRAGEPESAERGVRVNVLEGPHAGDVATIQRRYLRAAP